MAYPTNRFGNGRPRDSKHITSWYSPSGRYIQFAPQEKKFDCGTEAKLELMYTTNSREDYKLSVIVSET